MTAVVSGLMAKLESVLWGASRDNRGGTALAMAPAKGNEKNLRPRRWRRRRCGRFQNLLGSSGELLKCAHDLAVGGVGGDEIGGSVSSTEGFLSLAPIFTQRIHPQSEVNTCWQQRIRSPHQAR